MSPFRVGSLYVQIRNVISNRSEPQPTNTHSICLTNAYVTMFAIVSVMRGGTASRRWPNHDRQRQITDRIVITSIKLGPTFNV